MKQVLLIEDDQTIALTSQSLLKPVCQLTHTISLKESYEIIQKINYDMILLDLGLPDGDGFSFVEKLNNQNVKNYIPIVIISADENEATKVKAFEMGAFDYIQKPFSLLEMKARISSHLNRNEKNRFDSNTNIIDLNNKIKLNSKNHQLQIFCNNELKSFELTNKEFYILRTFLENPNKILDRSEIMNNVWGGDFHLTDRTIDTHISAIRKKLGQYSRCIKAVRGIGYQFITEGVA